MDDVEAATSKPMRDRAAAESEPGELLAGNDAVLAAGERRDQAVQRIRATFCIYFMHNCTRTRTGRMLAAKLRQGITESLRNRGRSSDE